MEFGHPNYQHPVRAEGQFDITVDNFSSWVIYASITALAIDPELYRLHSGGDDCILFKRSDLASPEQSQVFASLLAHDSEDIQKYAKLLLRMLWTPPHLVPHLCASSEQLDALSSVKPPAVSSKTDVQAAETETFWDVDSELDIDTVVRNLTESASSTESSSTLSSLKARNKAKSGNVSLAAKAGH